MGVVPTVEGKMRTAQHFVAQGLRSEEERGDA